MAVEANLARRDEARLIESVVVKGDLSALNAAELTAYYARMCDSLGLTAATQPFALLKLNGKLIMYPTRAATDQLAAIHRLNREIIDGPRVIDVAGTKMIIAVCRATHPNGRVETAVATVPMADPINALMKAETKAKRRATLSILGLGMLDESELETIPASAKVAVEIPHDPTDDGQEPLTSPTSPTAKVTNAAGATEDLAKKWSSRVAAATVDQLAANAGRVASLSEPLRTHVLARYCARWVELAKTDAAAARRAHALTGDLRDAVLRAFDVEGVEGREVE